MSYPWLVIIVINVAPARVFYHCLRQKPKENEALPHFVEQIYIFQLSVAIESECPMVGGIKDL